MASSSTHLCLLFERRQILFKFYRCVQQYNVTCLLSYTWCTSWSWSKRVCLGLEMNNKEREKIRTFFILVRAAMRGICFNPASPSSEGASVWRDVSCVAQPILRLLEGAHPRGPVWKTEWLEATEMSGEKGEKIGNCSLVAGAAMHNNCFNPASLSSEGARVWRVASCVAQPVLRLLERGCPCGAAWKTLEYPDKGADLLHSPPAWTDCRPRGVVERLFKRIFGGLVRRIDTIKVRDW